MERELDRFLRQGFQARTEDRPADARRDLAQAVAIARRSGVGADVARALTALGQVERDLGLCELALQRYQEAAAIYRTEDDALRLAHTVRHIGDLHCHDKRLELAEPCYREALSIYRNHAATPRLDLANTLRGLALLKIDAGEAGDARRLWQEAHDLYAAANVEAGVAESVRWLGKLNKPG